MSSEDAEGDLAIRLALASRLGCRAPRAAERLGRATKRLDVLLGVGHELARLGRGTVALAPDPAGRVVDDQGRQARKRVRRLVAPTGCRLVARAHVASSVDARRRAKGT